MRKLLLPIFGLLCAATLAQAQLASEKQPIEITATGDTNYKDGVATAHGNVAIHAGDSDIYADSARYNAKTREILVEGHVRIYRTTGLFVGDRAIYNVDTKEIRAVDMRTDKSPYLIGGENVTTISEGAFLVSKGTFTTHDSSDPDFRLKARTVRVYEDDRVVFQNVTFYVKNVPVFWWPYMYQSLNDAFSYMVSPAYLSSWGPSVLSRVSMPITDDIQMQIRLDYRSRRGVAIGFEPDIRYGAGKKSWARLRTYFLRDANPDINRTSEVRVGVPKDRYRMSVQNFTNFTEDIYGTVDITKLSDEFLLQDFYPGEFQINPKPDNVLAATKTHPIYTLTAIGRFQANSFFETTERLPEIVLDIPRTPILGGPIFYEGETGVADLHRNFARDSGFQDYGTLRFDSFHQFLYPNTYFGWLSVVPRVGLRGTYYDETRDLGKTIFAPNPNPFIPDFLLPDPTLAMPLEKGGSTFRTVVNAGVESSFKISRTWEEAQTRSLGLDGLRHIIQPFTNFSWVSSSNSNPASILQFDRYQPSTQLRPIDFPQFTTVDSIDSWSIGRLGVRNRLQTRRDDLTVSWMDVETYIDVNFDNPFDKTQYSNLFNKINFTPVPWASFGVSSQVPVFEKGFTEVNTHVSIQPIANLQVSFAHRYLNQNPFFENSSLYVLSGYYRFNDHWGIGIQEQYEGTSGVLEQQRYSIYRDLTSWVASVGAIIRDNGGVKEYGVLFTFTLKALPKLGFDLNFDPAGADQTQ
ncbi:MAG TPA: LPS assembly protein LptD [Chthoniobacterales bacterium]|nr:LPS assembly protein LptD [Chthoniobacterales bacterium]